MYKINEEARRKGILEEYKLCVNRLEESIGGVQLSKWTATTGIDFISAIKRYEKVNRIVKDSSYDSGSGSDKDPFVECQNHVKELLYSLKKTKS
ncbi:MAG: hypothetical protein PVJ67_05520 [Candidatus Pacearchaeota archaeon]|jgi:hypothetical protein